MRTRLRGAIMLLGTGLTVVGCDGGGCNTPVAPRHVRYAEHHVVHVYHTSNGSVAYQGSDHYWYWYGMGDMSTPSWTRQTYSPDQAPVARGRVVREEEEELDELAESTAAIPEEPEMEVEEVAEPEPSAEPESSTDSSSSSDSGSDGGGGDGGD
jgi:hypothetical protein